MTNPPPTLLSAPARPTRSRANRWEVALWIFGVALILLGVGLGVGLALVLVSRSNTNFDSIDLAQETWIQVFELVSPGFVTGGVISLALAIFSRVLDTNARRRDALLPEAARQDDRRDTHESRPVEDAVSAPSDTSAPVPAQATDAATDYAAFTRPTDDRASTEA